tara:strand:+ start:53198 stop:53764 length:567 start_codon:yes stop_codon:yes gene_type:complete
MSWLKVHQRTAGICGLTLLLPALLYVYVMFSLLEVRGGAQAEINRMKPRLARLQGLIEYEDQLREAAVLVDSQVLELVYPVSEEQATVSAELQTQVRDIFSKAGLSVTNSQVLPVRAEGSFDYISVKLTVSGTLPALDEALAGVAAYLPLVLVESMDVYPARSARGGEAGDQQQLTASLQLLSLRFAQ